MLVRKLEHQIKDSEEHNASYADNQFDKAENLLLTKQEMRMEKMQHEVEVKRADLSSTTSVTPERDASPAGCQSKRSCGKN